MPVTQHGNVDHTVTATTRISQLQLGSGRPAACCRQNSHLDLSVGEVLCGLGWQTRLETEDYIVGNLPCDDA